MQRIVPTPTAHQLGIIFTTVPKNPIFDISLAVRIIHNDNVVQTRGTIHPITILIILIDSLRFIFKRNGKANSSQTTIKLQKICAISKPPCGQNPSSNIRKSSNVKS
jgi:hypothetical protein